MGRKIIRKGFGHFPSREEILAYRRLSAKQKLEWLEQANRFTAMVVKGKTRKIWEKFRRGELQVLEKTLIV